MNARVGRILALLLGLLVLGLGSRGLLVGGVGAATRAPLSIERDTFAQLGPGLSVGVLGGLRQVLANYFWLTGYLRWEERDPAGAEAAFALAVAADPEEWFFWSNGARMIAYDFPRWELREARQEAGGRALDPQKVAAIQSAYAVRALVWIDTAKGYFPDDPRVEIERAMLFLHALGDRRNAALNFRRAWEEPGAPLYTARIYAELMRAEGEAEVAYRWYREWLDGLPPGLREQQRPIVLPRIRELEQELGVGAEAAYRWPDAD